MGTSNRLALNHKLREHPSVIGFDFLQEDQDGLDTNNFVCHLLVMVNVEQQQPFPMVL
jgi:hypothetical protein